MIRPESFTVSRETFATARKKILAENDEQLRPHVKDALRRVGLPSWEMQIVAAALDIFDTTARAEVDEWSPVIDDMRDNFELEMSQALAQTKASDSLEKQAETITRWVSAAAHNAAIEAATTSDPDLNIGLEWVTMSDDSVREAHKDAAGQRVPTGQAFDIDGSKLMYPGQPVGDPANWINCRCLAMPTMLDTEFDATTAEFAAGDVSRETPDAGDQVAEEPITSAVIVALPAADDPISAVSSERSGAHATLLFFGDTAALDEQALKDALEQFVTNGQVGIITEQVNGRATLGKDAADVVLFDAANLVFIRSGLLEDNTIIQAHQSVEQFPTWLPHVTLGYPEAPARGEYTGEAITFDRLALWFGESRTEYPLGGHVVPAEEPKQKQSTGEEALNALTALLAAAGLPAATDEAPAEAEAGAPSDEELMAALEDEAYPEVPWYGVLAPESIFSGDGRAFTDEALTQRPLPLPLKFMWEDDEGHTGSFPIGRIDRIWRDAGLIKAEGVFDTSPQAYEAVRLLANQIMRGVSVDLDAAALSADSDGTTFEFSAGRICSATICSIPAFAEAFVSIGTWADVIQGDVVEEGVEAPTPDVSRETVDASLTEFDTPPVKTMDGPGWITDPEPTHQITSYWVDGRGAAKIGWGAPGDFNRCRVHLAKYVQNPEWLAGLCANLHYRALGVWPGQASLSPQTVMNQPIAPAALTASAAVLEEVSVEYFKNPMLEGPTPVTLGKDGHIFGHLAEWGTCHIGYEQCTTPPHSVTDYSYFLTGQVFTDAGPVAVGQLTVGGGHADPQLGIRAAIAHYDNVGTAVADVTVYEDDWGIAFSGRLRPWATPQQIHELFAAGPSGDWRIVTSRGRSSLEMCAAHAVNVPGFPVPRTRFAVAHGQQVSMVAAGALAPVLDPAEVFAKLDAEIRAYEFSSLFKEIGTLEGK
ncbi:capsid maturation protease [Arthrobacter phage BruhMoment]|nr:capsid maturation protease [Arthrobacter phage BruhMoment]